MSRGAEPREAKLHEGASEPAVDTCLISAVAIRKAPSSPNDCRSPCGTRAVFAVIKMHVSRSAINTIPHHSAAKRVLDKTAKPVKSFFATPSRERQSAHPSPSTAESVAAERGRL